MHHKLYRLITLLRLCSFSQKSHLNVLPIMSYLQCVWLLLKYSFYCGNHRVSIPLLLDTSDSGILVSLKMQFDNSLMHSRCLIYICLILELIEIYWLQGNDGDKKIYFPFWCFLSSEDEQLVWFCFPLQDLCFQSLSKQKLEQLLNYFALLSIKNISQEKLLWLLFRQAPCFQPAFLADLFLLHIQRKHCQSNQDIEHE